MYFAPPSALMRSRMVLLGFGASTRKLPVGLLNSSIHPTG